MSVLLPLSSWLFTRAQQMVVLLTTTFCFLKIHFSINLLVPLVLKDVSSLQFSDKNYEQDIFVTSSVHATRPAYSNVLDFIIRCNPRTSLLMEQIHLGIEFVATRSCKFLTTADF
jgi:hypothetical protein